MSEIIVRLKDNSIKITGGEYVRDMVRCKDCVNYEGSGKYCKMDLQTNDNGYCHHGERKDA